MPTLHAVKPHRPLAGSPRLLRPSAQERQVSIIAAAASMFAANGFKGTTTRAIAKAAGISEALLFKYFPTKRALYAAILKEKVSISELLATVEDAAKKRDDERVFSLIAGHRIRRGADPTLLRLLLFSALEGHELSAMFFRTQHRVFYDYLAGYIAQRIKEGAFRQVDPMLAAKAFTGMLAHHRLLHEIFRVPTHRSPEDSVAAYVALFLDGMVSAPSNGRRPASRGKG
ncbi:MAG: TetR/AcrR family transcriptional regulator [Nitrospiraceae bacterium]